VNSIKDFHSRLLNKMSDAGSIYNTLENTKSLLESQRVEIESMLSSEKDLDMAKAIIDMQNYEYLLQVSYKMSAMILPKSLLDFI
jgi:flagellin-like hook-associated protein FlgL